MERIARTPRQLGAAIRCRRNGFRLALAVGDDRHYVMDEILPRHFARTAARAGTPVGTVAGICAELADTAEGTIEAALNSLPESFPGTWPTRSSRACARVWERSGGPRRDPPARLPAITESASVRRSAGKSAQISLLSHAHFGVTSRDAA